MIVKKVKYHLPLTNIANSNKIEIASGHRKRRCCDVIESNFVTFEQLISDSDSKPFITLYHIANSNGILITFIRFECAYLVSKVSIFLCVFYSLSMILDTTFYNRLFKFTVHENSQHLFFTSS